MLDSPRPALPLVSSFAPSTLASFTTAKPLIPVCVYACVRVLCERTRARARSTLRRVSTHYVLAWFRLRTEYGVRFRGRPIASACTRTFVARLQVFIIFHFFLEVIPGFLNTPDIRIENKKIKQNQCGGSWESTNEVGMGTSGGSLQWEPTPSH